MSQPACLNDRLRSGDRAIVTVPVIEHPITINETHAATLGAAIGLVAGERGSFFKTILHEPWWFVGVLALAYALGRQLR